MGGAKAKEPSKGGMPRFVPTDEDRALVKLLIANGFAQHVVSIRQQSTWFAYKRIDTEARFCP